MSAAALIDFDPSMDLLNTIVDVMIREPLPGEFREVLWELLRNTALQKGMIPTLTAWAAETPPRATEIERVELGRRRAVAAISLIKLAAWEPSLAAFLKGGDDLESLSQFVVHAKAGLTEKPLMAVWTRPATTTTFGLACSPWAASRGQESGPA